MSETYQTVEAQRNALRVKCAELEAQQAAMLRAMSAASDESAACIAELQAQLEAARLLLVAIDENLDMCQKWTLTTERIAELLRDPASNPWAALMRAGKEGGGNA